MGKMGEYNEALRKLNNWDEADRHYEEEKMSEPTIKEIENNIALVERIIKKHESHLDNLKQLHISKLLELKDETIVMDDIGQIYNPENIKGEENDKGGL